MIEEGDDQLHRKVFEAQGTDLDVPIVGGKGQQQPVGVAIGVDGRFAAALDLGQIVNKELIEAG
jgi:hypothetical protein